MKIAFYGSSLLSCYWNGAATYYRGLLKALADIGHEITFYEPDVLDRGKHRDIDPPSWCRVVVYDGTVEASRAIARHAADADVVIKASGVGFDDDGLLDALLANARDDALKIFWDVDAPATLAAMMNDPGLPLRRALPRLDAVFTYGGGDPVVNAYRKLGAPDCIPVYNALDPETHHPVPTDQRFTADLGFLGNYLPDRAARMEEFFVAPATRLGSRRFIVGGAGWHEVSLPPNIRAVGHVPSSDHNAFNVTPTAVLNVARDSMAANGFSPATRVFEAAGAGACLITDAWNGIELFLQPDDEVLVARDGQDVAEIVATLSPHRARAIGKAAFRRVAREHTYERRAAVVDRAFRLHARRRRDVA